MKKEVEEELKHFIRLWGIIGALVLGILIAYFLILVLSFIGLEERISGMLEGYIRLQLEEMGYVPCDGFKYEEGNVTCLQYHMEWMGGELGYWCKCDV